MKWLEKLGYGHESIFELDLMADGKTVQFMEACDLYFTTDLNKKEFGELIEELQEIHKIMKDS